MKKTCLLIFFVSSSVFAQEPLNGLGEQLNQIKAQIPDAKVIGLVFNPSDVSLEGQRVSIKTMALPATSAHMLVKNMRLLIKKVDAIYLIKGKNVTTLKMARFILKSSAKSNVKVFTNDPALADLPGIGIIQVGLDGSFAVQYAAN